MEKRWENMHFDRLRKTIFTAFVDNVSLRVSWKDLKAFFNQFGVVVDIYLPRVSRNRITRYAFVRYRYRVELNRAIDMGPNRRLDGRTLSIKEANKPKENSYRTGERPTRIWQEMGVGNGRRTFREVVTNGALYSDYGDTRKLYMEKENINSFQETKELEGIRVPIEADEVECTQRSAIGNLRETVSCKAIESYLACEGVTARVRPVGGMNVLVTFDDREEMETLLRQYFEIFEKLFQELKPYNLEKDERRYKGRFITVDQATEKKSRLDQAIIKVEVTSKRRVLTCLQVIVNGKKCTMRATIIETETIDIDLKTFSVIEKKLEELRPSNSQESQQADGIRAGSTVHGMDMTHVRKMRVEIKHGEDQPDMALENRTSMTRQIEGSSSQGHRSQNEGDP
ncbi:hypothetical protein QUC31_019378 [Theobroma cacao]